MSQNGYLEYSEEDYGTVVLNKQWKNIVPNKIMITISIKVDYLLIHVAHSFPVRAIFEIGLQQLIRFTQFCLLFLSLVARRLFLEHYPSLTSRPAYSSFSFSSSFSNAT